MSVETPNSEVLPKAPGKGAGSIAERTTQLSSIQRFFRKTPLVGALALAVAFIASPPDNSDALREATIRPSSDNSISLTDPLLSLAIGALEPKKAEALALNNNDQEIKRNNLETESNPFSPYEFTSNDGEKVKVTIIHNTGSLFPNDNRIPFMDTAKIEIEGQPTENLQASTDMYQKYNPNINDQSSICVQYKNKDNNLVFIDNVRTKNQSSQAFSYSIPREVPWKTRKDYSTQSILPSDLPIATVDIYPTSCINSDDESSMDIKTNQNIFYRLFNTGVVKIMSVFKIFIAVVLDSTK